MLYEFKCTPPNERSTLVRIEAATLQEALQRAEKLWCRQMHQPILLGLIDTNPQACVAVTA